MKDLKLTVELIDKASKQIDQLASKLSTLGTRSKTENAKAVSEAEKTSKQMQSTQERMERDRIRMQRASIALEERVERQRAAAMERNSRNSLQMTQSRASAVQRIERQAALAESSLVLDKFDRRIAIERTKHAQILVDLKGNHAAIEAEKRRHGAVINRVQMDQGNFANTPFQKMLESFNKLNNGLGKFTPAMSAMPALAGSAGAAMTGFGGALSSLTLGPLGAVLLAVTALNAGVNALIGNAEKAANMRADLGSAVRDPEKIKQMLAIREKYDKAKAARGKNVTATDAVYYDPAVAEMEKASKEWKAIAGVRLEEETLWTAERLKKQGAAAAKTTDAAKQALKDAKDAQEERWSWERDVREASQRNQEKADNYAEKKADEKRKLAVDIIQTEEAYKQKALKESKEKSEAEGKNRVSLRTAQAGDDEIAKLRVKHDQEIAEAERAGVALVDITARHEIEKTLVTAQETEKRKKLAEQEAEKKLASTSNFFNGFAALTAQANMKDRASRVRWKALAIAEATANTFGAANKALNSAPPPFNFIAMAGVIAAGLANVNQIKEQKFARGTDFAPGGMALVGEQGPEMVYLPRGSKVKTASETRQMSGGFSHHGTVQIVVNVPAGASQAQANAAGAMVAEGYQEQMRKWRRLERDVSFYGARA